VEKLGRDDCEAVRNGDVRVFEDCASSAAFSAAVFLEFHIIASKQQPGKREVICQKFCVEFQSLV
jgi:hypothetical protein